MSFSSPYSLPYNDTPGYPSSPFEKLAAKLAVGYQAKEFTALLSDLQANILAHHRKKFSRFYFIRFNDEKVEHLQNAIEWIQNISKHITSAKEQFDNPKNPVCCLYLTWKGYCALKLDHLAPSLETNKAFEEGMRNRVRFDVEKDIFDTHLYPQDAPDKGIIHAMLMVASDNEHEEDIPNPNSTPDVKPLPNLIKSIDEGWAYKAEQKGIIIERKFEVWEDEDKAKKNKKAKNKIVEWFGFRDGVSQPLFFPDAYKNNKGFEIDSVAPLRIVLTRDKGGQNKYSAGSFLAFLKLEQNVKKFRENVKKVQEKISGKDPDLAAAYLIGRFYDGTSVFLSKSPENIESPKNYFDYSKTYISNGEIKAKRDEKGIRCPFASHARKANPRDDKEAVFIVRRGVCYDEQLGADNKPKPANTKWDEKDTPEKDVGLLFMSFQSSLDNQFEYILNNWILSERKGTQRIGIDILAGGLSANHKNPFWFLPKEWGGDDANQMFNSEEIKPCVKFKGGEYFFAPSISFLKRVGVNSYIPKKIKQEGGDTEEELEGIHLQMTKNKGEKKEIVTSIEKEAVRGAFKIPHSFGKGKK